MQPIKSNTQFYIKDESPSSQTLNWQDLFAKIQDDNVTLNRQETQETIERALNAIPSTDIWVDEILKTAQDKKLIPVLEVVFGLCKNHPLVQELPLKLEQRFSEISRINIDLLCHFMSPSDLSSEIIEYFSKSSLPCRKLAATLLFRYMGVLAQKLSQREGMSEFKRFFQKDHERLYALCKLIPSLKDTTFQEVLQTTTALSFDSKIERKSKDYPYFGIFCYSLSDRQWKAFIEPFLAKEKDPRRLSDLCQETTLMARNCQQQHRLLDVMRILIKHPRIHAEEIINFLFCIVDKDLRGDLWKVVCQEKFKQPQDLADWFLNAKMHPNVAAASMSNLVEEYLKDQSEDAKLQFIQSFVPKKNESGQQTDTLLIYWKYFSNCLLSVAPNLAGKLFILCKEIGLTDREISKVEVVPFESSSEAVDSDGDEFDSSDLDVEELLNSRKIIEPSKNAFEQLLKNIFFMTYSGVPGWKEAVAAVMNEAKVDLTHIKQCIQNFESIALEAREEWTYSSNEMQEMEHANFFKEVFSNVPMEYLLALREFISLRTEVLAGLVLCNQDFFVLKKLENTCSKDQLAETANLMNLVASLQSTAVKDLMETWLTQLKQKRVSKMQEIIKLQPFLDHPESINSLIGLLSNEDFSKLAIHLVNDISKLLKQNSNKARIELEDTTNLWILPLSVEKFKIVLKEASFEVRNFILQLYLQEKNLDPPSKTAKKLASLLSFSASNILFIELKYFYEAIIKILPFERDAAREYAIKFWNAKILAHLLSKLSFCDFLQNMKIDSTQLCSPVTVANQINEYLDGPLKLRVDDVNQEIQKLLLNQPSDALALYLLAKPNGAKETMESNVEKKIPHQKFKQLLPMFIYDLSIEKLEKLLKDRQEIWSELPSLIPFCSPSQQLWLKDKIAKIGKNEHNSHEFVLPIHVLFRLKRALNMPINPVVQTSRKRKRQESESESESESVFVSAIPKHLRGSLVEKFPLKGDQLEAHKNAIMDICEKYSVTLNDLDTHGLEFITIHAILMHCAEDLFTSFSKVKESDYRALLVVTAIEALDAKKVVSQEDFLKYLKENS